MPDTPTRQPRARRAAAAAAERKTNGKPTRADAEQQGHASAEVVVSEAEIARQILAPMRDQIAAQLPGQIPSESFYRVLLTMLQDTKSGRALRNCDRPTLYRAILDAARFGLMPGTDEGAIVAFGTTATFIPQYQGFIKMFYNTGQVASVTAKLIYKRDRWGLVYGDGGGFMHEPRLFDEDGLAVARGRIDMYGKPATEGPGADNPPILAYCFIRFKDGSRTEVEVVTLQDAIETRDKYSRSWKNAEKGWDGKAPKRDSAWHTDFGSQWLKTAVRRGAKYAPKSAQLLELLLADNADSVVGQPAPPPALPAPEPSAPAEVREGGGNVIPGVGLVEPPDPPAGGPGEARSAAEAWDQAAPPAGAAS